MAQRDIIKELADSFSESGIDKGDTLMIHSQLSEYLRRYRSKGIDVTPHDILEAFIESAGEKGTLIFPTYNFDFTKGLTFDIRNTRSETGILTEIVRQHPDSVRTGHPLFSFAAMGYHKDRFKGLYNYSAFGSDSPFAILMELKGKIAMLDITGENCMTFHHYVEEMEKAPNRKNKLFKGRYIDYDGTETEREFNVYSRILEDGVVTDVKPIVDLYRSKGLITGSPPGTGSCLSVIKAEVVYEEASKVIKERKALGMLYRIEK